MSTTDLHKAINEILGDCKSQTAKAMRVFALLVDTKFEDQSTVNDEQHKQIMASIQGIEKKFEDAQRNLEVVSFFSRYPNLLKTVAIAMGIVFVTNIVIAISNF